MSTTGANGPDDALGCPHLTWTYEGSWSRDGAFYVRRCARCARPETVTKDQFFAAIAAFAEWSERRAVADELKHKDGVLRVAQTGTQS